MGGVCPRFGILYAGFGEKWKLFMRIFALTIGGGDTRQGSTLRRAGNRLGKPGCNRLLWHRNLAPASTASPRGVAWPITREGMGSRFRPARADDHCVCIFCECERGFRRRDLDNVGSSKNYDV